MKNKKSISQKLSGYGFIFIFIAIFVAYLFIAQTTWNGVMNILRHSAVTGMISIGMGLIIITGGIDLSVGSSLALVGGLAVVVFNSTNSIMLTLIFSLGAGAVCGAINGILIGKAKMPAFIVTLGTMLIYRSVSQYILTNMSLSIYNMNGTLSNYHTFFSLGQALPLTIPLVGIIFMLVTLLFVYIATSTKFGKAIYAVGSNEKAARLAGVNVDMVRVLVYVITGVLVGGAAFLWLAMNGSVDPATVGRSYEMYAIAAVVIGGISMSGGKGKILGVFFGAMSYAIIDKIIASLGLDALINDTIKGSILLLAIFIQIMIPVLKDYINKKFIKNGANSNNKVQPQQIEA